MFKSSTGQSPEEALGHGNPQYGSGSTDGTLATLEAAEDYVEDDFLVWDATSAERSDELTEKQRYSQLYNAYDVSVPHRLVSSGEWKHTLRNEQYHTQHYDELVHRRISRPIKSLMISIRLGAMLQAIVGRG